MSTRPRGAAVAGPFIHGIRGIGDYATPVSIPPFRRFWNFAPGGANAGFGGLGDCVTDPDSGVTSCTDTTTLQTGGGYFGMPTGVTPVATGGGGVTAQQAAGIAQQGFQDVFSVLKLFNPVPPGTVMQTGPGGTSFISRAAAGSSTPSGISLGGSSFGPILLIGGGLLLLVAFSKGRG